MTTPIWKTTVNYSGGRNNTNVDRIVIHYIVGTLAAADAVFANPASGVSAHYGIGEGALHQYVSEMNTAWHAGNLAMNRRSIGIEHSADQNRAPSSDTYTKSIDLCEQICRDYGIDPITGIIPHSSVVSTLCPGTVDITRIRNSVSARIG